MNKLVLFFLIIGITVEAQDFYISNSLGMELTKIEDSESRDIEWLLIKEKKEGRYFSTLFNWGEETKQFIREYNDRGVEIFFGEVIKGIPVEETEYSGNGSISVERFFNPEGQLIEIKNYIYRYDGKLLRIESTDGSGSAGASRDYQIRYDGSIRSLSETDKDTLKHSEVWNAFGGALYLEQRTQNSEREMVYYDENKLISRIEYYAGDLLVYEDRFIYSDLNVLESISKKNFISFEFTDIFMNGDGEILKEIVSLNQIFQYTVLYTYSEGNLVKKEKTGSQVKEKWLYYYENNNKTEEEYYKQGILIQKKIILSSENNNYNIQLYNNGAVFMNLVYENDVKIREEFLDKGQIIRYRDLGDL
jgi:hypothetical protein